MTEYIIKFKKKLKNSEAQALKHFLIKTNIINFLKINITIFCFLLTVLNNVILI